MVTTRRRNPSRLNSLQPIRNLFNLTIEKAQRKRARDYLGNFEVVDDSFVRDNPQPNAAVIATLRPGTQVRVESKTGEYFRIRSLHDPEVIGYVHEEDAFFQAH